jgi:hypothetical protein
MMQATNHDLTEDRPPGRRLRFSIAGLLLAILTIGSGLAALCRPSNLAANTVFSLMVLALGVAVIAALYRNEPARAFWTGFLAFGSLYAVLSLTPCFYQNLGNRLLTTTILDMLYPSIPPLPRSTNTKPSPWELWAGRPSDYDHYREHSGVSVSTTDYLHVIGHSLFAMLAAAGGGLLARRFYETRTRDSANA